MKATANANGVPSVPGPLLSPVRARSRLPMTSSSGVRGWGIRGLVLPSRKTRGGEGEQERECPAVRGMGTPASEPGTAALSRVPPLLKAEGQQKLETGGMERKGQEKGERSVRGLGVWVPLS